jgi:hypothetical protein
MYAAFDYRRNIVFVRQMYLFFAIEHLATLDNKVMTNGSYIEIIKYFKLYFFFSAEFSRFQ